MNQLNFAGNKFQDELLEELTGYPWEFLDGIETVIEQNWFTHGAYRPHRYLPALYKGKQTLESYVIPHGTVIALETLKNPDGSWNQYAGIDAAGKQWQAVGVSGNIQMNAYDTPYGYDPTLDGVIIPANGTNADIDDHYTIIDPANRSIKNSGGFVLPADVGTTVALTRRTGNKALGIAYYQLMRETNGVAMSYRLEIAAISAMRKGILHIPYVIAGPTTIAAPNKQPGGDAAYTAVYDRHQFLLIEDPSLMRTESVVNVDGNGKFILPSAANAATYPQKLGKLLTWSPDTQLNLIAEVDGYPGLNVPGTNTGGATRRMYNFVASILAAHNQPYGIQAVTAELKANPGKYGMCKLLINTNTVS